MKNENNKIFVETQKNETKNKKSPQHSRLLELLNKNFSDTEIEINISYQLTKDIS